MVAKMNASKAKIDDFIISGKKAKHEAKASNKSLRAKASGFVKDIFF